ncbi:hypothetical protein COOONC_12568 [Cooperia oncophora]
MDRKATMRSSALTTQTMKGWPQGYIPIAIHTVDDDTDYVVNTEAICERREILWSMAKSSKKLQAFQRRPDVSLVLFPMLVDLLIREKLSIPTKLWMETQIATLLANLTKWCGETINIDNLWIVRDA